MQIPSLGLLIAYPSEMFMERWCGLLLMQQEIVFCLLLIPQFHRKLNLDITGITWGFLPSGLLLISSSLKECKLHQPRDANRTVCADNDLTDSDF